MKLVKLLISFVFLSFILDAQQIDWNTQIKNRPISTGTAAPSSGNCDAAAELNTYYLQTGDPATVVTQLWECVQTGASSYAWHPISHKTGATAPVTCTAGQVFFDTDAAPGQNWYGCTAADTWTLLGSGGNMSITSGLASALPATCTASTQYYLATDTQEVYVCTATDTWKLFITSTGTGAASIEFPTAAMSVGSASAVKIGAHTGNLFAVSRNGAALEYPAMLAGDLSGTQGSPTVSKINGTSLAGLSTGILKNTTGTGVPSIAAASDIPSQADRSETLTNKTLDVEGTGNSITTVSKIWLETAGCQNATATLMWDTPTTNPAVAACVTGTNTQKGVADFADGANALSMQRTLVLPSDWTGSIDAKFKWFTTATSGDVVWQLATICVADAETDDPAFNSASTVTDTAKGTTNQLNDASITGLTATGCAAGELMHLKLLRDPAHASDTLAATARLVGVELTMRRAQ